MHSLEAVHCGYCRFSVVSIDTVSIKLITALVVSGCRSKLVNVVSGAPQVSVLGQLLLLLYTSELFSVLENKLIGHADDRSFCMTLMTDNSA